MSREGRLDEVCGVAEGTLVILTGPAGGLTLKARVAAFAASGGCERIEVESFVEDVDLVSLPGLRVLSMRPFFSGEGVRDGFALWATGAIKEDMLVVCVRVRVDAVPELFLGVNEGRLGKGGGRERSL